MRTPAFCIGALLAAGMAAAFPPAPHHEIFGTVRDEKGHPLPEGATVTLSGTGGKVLAGEVGTSFGPGMNYSLKVPMDAGTLAQLYQSTALQPTMPITATVRVGGTDYVPIEVQGGMLQIGDPGGRTRLDLTLGVDSDGDGLPDAWEQEVIAAVDGLDSLADVTPEGDADHDGASNYLEYLAGTYAFDGRAVFRFDVVEVKDGRVHLRFLAVKGRSYRLQSAPDGESFAPVAFSLRPDGSEPTTVFRAEAIRFRDVYLPAAEDGSQQLYRLHVE